MNDLCLYICCLYDAVSVSRYLLRAAAQYRSNGCCSGF